MAKKYFVVAEGNEHVVMKHVKVAEAYDGLKEVVRYASEVTAESFAADMNKQWERMQEMAAVIIKEEESE